MYSLGVLIHAVFNEGKPVFKVNKQDIFKSFSRQLDQVKSPHSNFNALFPVLKRIAFTFCSKNSVSQWTSAIMGP